MELGSQVCKPVNPDCKVCPLQRSCKAYAEVGASRSPIQGPTEFAAARSSTPITDR